MNRSAIGIGTCGGMLFSMFPSLLMGDMLKTILLAAVGAFVSFFVSLILSILVKRKK